LYIERVYNRFPEVLCQLEDYIKPLVLRVAANGVHGNSIIKNFRGV
jgi:hypothetical protein